MPSAALPHLLETPLDIRNRIVDHREVLASDLKPNPRNWRTHPPEQANALRGILAEVGIVDELMVRELEDGTLELIDGHLRADTLPDMKLPVAVTDLTAEEADKILLTFDPLAAMAGQHAETLASLLADVESENEGVTQMLRQLAEDSGITPPDFQPVGVDEQGRLDQKSPVTCPECGHEFTT